MADASNWYVWLTEPSIIPPEQFYVLRAMSWFFITLALTPIVPILLLVIYDFSLWGWRLVVASPHAKKVKEQPNGVDESPNPQTNGLDSNRPPEARRRN